METDTLDYTLRHPTFHSTQPMVYTNPKSDIGPFILFKLGLCESSFLLHRYSVELLIEYSSDTGSGY